MGNRPDRQLPTDLCFGCEDPGCYLYPGSDGTYYHPEVAQRNHDMIQHFRQTDRIKMAGLASFVMGGFLFLKMRRLQKLRQRRQKDISPVSSKPFVSNHFSQEADAKENERSIEWAKAHESIGENQESDGEGGQWGCHYCRLAFSSYLRVGEIICRECYVIGQHIGLDE